MRKVLERLLMEIKKNITLYDHVLPLVFSERNFLIPKAELREMLAAKDLKALTAKLAKYYPVLTGSEPILDLERIHHAFHEDFIEKIHKIIRHSPNSARPFLMNFLIEFEIENLVTILRSRVIKKSASDISDRIHWQVEEYTNNKEIIENIIKKTDFPIIFDLLKRTFYEEFIIKAEKRYQDKKSLMYVNTFLDYAQIVLMMRSLDRLSKFDKKIASEYTNLIIEYFDFMILFRAKSFDLEEDEIREFLIPDSPYFILRIINSLLPINDLQSLLESIKSNKFDGKSSFLKYSDATSSYFDVLTQMERTFFQKSLKFVNKIKNENPFSICTPLSFILFKKFQIRDLIQISSSLEYHLSEDWILDRLILLP